MDANIPTFILASVASTGILFGIVWLIKKFFKKQLSALLHYALWGVLILRLLLPVSFASVINPWAWFPAAPQEQAAQQTGNSNTHHTIPLNAMTKNPETGMSAATTPAKAAVQTEGQTSNALSYDPIPSQQAAKPFEWDWNAFALYLWGAGTSVVCLWLCIGSIRVRRRIGRSVLPAPVWMQEAFEACRRELGIKRSIRLVIQRALPVPAIMGLFKPMLVLPVSLGDVQSEQLRHILLHELTHFKHRDIVVNFLLNPLSAIYWWNPLVWLAVRLIRKDMETLCDSHVIAMLGKERRQGYIATVLGFAGKRNHPRLQAALGMSSGQSAGPRRMKQRVHGMFRRRKTRLAVKIPLFILVAAMLAGAFTTACQPTPEKPVIVNKGDGKLDQLIAQTDVPKQKYAAPPSWKETVHSLINGTDITIDLDATVEVPDISAYPVVSIQPAQITFEQIEALLGEVVKGQTLYDAGFAEVINTKEKIRGKIDYYTKELAASQGKGFEQTRKQYEKILEKLYKDLETAPENYAEAEAAAKQKLEAKPQVQIKDGEVVPASEMLTDIGPVTITQDNCSRARGFDLVIGEKYRAATLKIYASDKLQQQRMEYYSRGARSGSQSGSVELLNTLKNSRQDAEKEARRIAALLNTGLELTDVCAMTDFDYSGTEPKEMPVGYVFCFTRLYNGVPMKYSYDFGSRGKMNVQQALGEGKAEQYREPWQDERLEIAIGEEGLESLIYHSPAKVVKTESENVALMPFDQIQEIFRKQILLRPIWTEITETTKVYAKLDHVALTMVKVAKKDDPDTYRMIPAWDFCGNFKRAYMEDGRERESNLSNFYFRSFLTINAMDGSIIDRAMGF